MTPKFTTPCFIRKNTLELRKKLEELGFVIDEVMYNITDEILCTCDNEYHSVREYETEDLLRCQYIDCETNEQLFLALAALREDSDKFQWFIRDELHETYSKFVLCELEDWDSDFYSWSNDDDMFPYMYHKATPAELIEHFKEQ